MIIAFAPIGTRIEKPKKCSCGIVHNLLPSIGKINRVGIWFNCHCGSTLLIKGEVYGNDDKPSDR